MRRNPRLLNELRLPGGRQTQHIIDPGQDRIASIRGSGHRLFRDPGSPALPLLTSQAAILSHRTLAAPIPM